MGSTLSLTMRRHNKNYAARFLENADDHVERPQQHIYRFRHSTHERVCAKYGALNLAQGFRTTTRPNPSLNVSPKWLLKGRTSMRRPGVRRTSRSRSVKRSSTSAELEYDPNSEVCVTCGGTEAMMASVLGNDQSRRQGGHFFAFYETTGRMPFFRGSADFVPLKPPVL